MILASKMCEVYDKFKNDNCIVSNNNCTESNNEICKQSCTDEEVRCSEVLKCWNQITINTSLWDCCEGSYILDYEPGKENDFSISKNNEGIIFECHNKMSARKFESHLHTYNRLCGRNKLIREIFNAEGNREELLCQHIDELNNSSDSKYFFSIINAPKLKMNNQGKDSKTNVMFDGIDTQNKIPVAIYDEPITDRIDQYVELKDLFNNDLMNDDSFDHDLTRNRRELSSTEEADTNYYHHKDEAKSMMEEPISYLGDDTKVNNFLRKRYAGSSSSNNDFEFEELSGADTDFGLITSMPTDTNFESYTTPALGNTIEGSSYSIMNYMKTGVGIGVLIGIIFCVIIKFIKRRNKNRRDKECTKTHLLNI